MKSLLERLELEVRLVEALLVASEEERLALGSGDMERILACTERKKNIMQAYESLGISRDRLLDRLPHGRDVIEGRCTLQTWVDRETSESDPVGAQLRQVVATLKDSGARLQRANQTNSVLLQRALDLTMRTRAAITGELGSAPVYTRRGQFRAPASNAAVFRGRG